MDIRIPKGIKIGHADNGHTGVTVLLCEKGGTAGVDVRGGAPATRETDLLRSEKTVQKVHAVVLSGGSAYGLAAFSGVMNYLREKNVGFKMPPHKVVPIVTGACIYDLNEKDYHFPDEKMGYDACVNAVSTPVFGQCGGGMGATVGKIRGVQHASKGGIGASTVRVAGLTVTAVVVVNAFGDVVLEDGTIIAGAKGKNGQFIDTERCLLEGDVKSLIFGTNTTIGCILTNAKLSKTECNKLCSAAHDGFARSIRPVHTDYDGDALFALSTGRVPVLNSALLHVAVVDTVAKAVRNACTSGIGYDVCCDTDDDEVCYDIDVDETSSSDSSQNEQ